LKVILVAMLRMDGRSRSRGATTGVDGGSDLGSNGCEEPTRVPDWWEVSKRILQDPWKSRLIESPQSR
jgi:hypothetical protein